MANTTGLGDTIYAAVRKAIEDAGSGGGGGGSATQTLTVTKADASDTVLVVTTSWADYIADNDAYVEVQPDSTDGLVSVYSIPVGTAFFASINDVNADMYFDAEMEAYFNTIAMPSTPLYASKTR